MSQHPIMTLRNSESKNGKCLETRIDLIITIMPQRDISNKVSDVPKKTPDQPADYGLPFALK